MLDVDSAVTKIDTINFASGQDNWINPELLDKKKELMEQAKSGCEVSKSILMSEPYNLLTWVSEGEVII